MTPGRRRRWIALLGLAALFLASRLYGLLALPMFIDESIYLFWARRIVDDGRFWRPLADGKSLQVWLLALVVPWAPHPLAWGRAVSVLVGGVGMGAAWALGRRLRDERAGVIAAALYLICPFALFHDRMVLADVFLSTAAALTLLASLDLADRPTIRRGLVVGLAMTACVLCKIPGLLVFATPLLAAALLPRRPGMVKAAAAAYALAIALSALPVAYFLLYSTQIQEQAILPDSEIGPVAIVAVNLGTVAGWLWAYWTPAVCAVGGVTLVMALVQRRREEILLGACAVLPLAAFTLLSRSWFPRYVFFATIPVLVLTALSLSRLVAQLRGLARTRGGPWILLPGLLGLAALLRPALDFDRLLLTRPGAAPLPDVDRLQYVDGWSAGYGRADVARALARERARSRQGVLVSVSGSTKHDWRPLHLLLRARFMNDPGVEIDVGLLSDQAAREAFLARAGARPAFVAFASEQGTFPASLGPPLMTGVRADGTVATALYRLSPGAAPH